MYSGVQEREKVWLLKRRDTAIKKEGMCSNSLILSYSYSLYINIKNIKNLYFLLSYFLALYQYLLLKVGFYQPYFTIYLLVLTIKNSKNYIFILYYK